MITCTSIFGVAGSTEMGMKESSADVVVEGIAYLVKFGLRETGRLRGCVMDTADVAESRTEAVCLVVVDPKLSAEAIQNTWDLSVRIFREDALNRMSVVVVRNLDGGGRLIDGYPRQPSDEDRYRIDKIVTEMSGEKRVGGGQPPGQFHPRSIARSSRALASA